MYVCMYVLRSWRVIDVTSRSPGLSPIGTDRSIARTRQRESDAFWGFSVLGIISEGQREVDHDTSHTQDSYHLQFFASTLCRILLPY